jgi:ribosomal protein S12 methylthiotransferase accessory factor
MACIRLSPAAFLVSKESGVVLHSDLGTFTLGGRDAVLFVDMMLPLLDGTRNRDEIADAVSEDLRPSVFAFLDLLERHGLLETVLDEVHDPLQARWTLQERFFRVFMEQPADATRRLGEASVLIVGLEPWGLAVASELAAAGIGTLHVLDDGHVASTDLLSVRMWHAGLLGRPRGQALAEVLATAAPWCRVTTSSSTLDGNGSLAVPQVQWDLVIGTMAPDDLAQQFKLAQFAHEAGLVSLFGSVVIPGKTACWNCSRLRRLANADHPWAAHVLQDEALSARRAIVARPRLSLAPMASLVGHLLALEALKLLSGYVQSRLLGRLLVHNMVTLETTTHTIIPMPWCEVCGGARVMGPGEGTPSRLIADDTPESLRRSLAGWVDSRTGVISHLVLRDSDPSDPRLPVVAYAIDSEYTEGAYNPMTPAGGGGKGLTETEAMVGAVGEAIERYSASLVRLDDLHHSTMHALAGDVLDPRRLCLYDEAQYDRPGFPFVRFDPDRPHWWIRGHWMDTGEPVWVPGLPTFYKFPSGADDRFCQATSNGLAAGVDLEDASLRAAFELVERDAFMLTWLCRRPGRRLLVDDALERGMCEVLEQLQRCGAQIELYCLDVGLSIPTVVCLGLGDGQRWPGVTVSSAAHISPLVAARKAILEQGFSGPYLRRVMTNGKFPIPGQPEQIRTFFDHALFYVPAARTGAFDFLRSGDDTPISLGTLHESEVSLETCTEQLAAGGVRVAIVDVTAPDVAQSPFRVVRALGTDLQPIHCGFGVERLANPRLRALLIGELNPDPHPLC